MHQSLKPLVEIVLFNNALFASAVGDVSESEASEQPSDTTNSFRWVLGHVVTGRYVIGEVCGISPELPWEGVFMAATNRADLPAIPEIVATFDEMTPVLIKSLAGMDEKSLLTAPSSPFPTAEENNTGCDCFSAST